MSLKIANGCKWGSCNWGSQATAIQTLWPLDALATLRKPVTFGNLCGVPWRKSVFLTCQHVPTVNDMLPPIRACGRHIPATTQHRLPNISSQVTNRIGWPVTRPAWLNVITQICEANETATCSQEPWKVWVVSCRVITSDSSCCIHRGFPDVENKWSSWIKYSR